MKLQHLLLILMIASPNANACGMHQGTGFSFVSEPGSLEVFGNVVDIRKFNVLGNVNKAENVELLSFKKALNKPHENKQNFSIFEATKGHYSDVTVGNGVLISARESSITEQDLLLITDLDVLDALASNVLSWRQAKHFGLVKINGSSDEADALELWLTALFPDSE
ncbi:hypothetical protein ACVFI8_19285 [Agarivorans sp. MS3-6]|uniref:hypothetical protein n=1 Tax=Agarivorans sp. TSD2052 TaxID=2937286 RepID=UPI00200D2CF8|nr:hypothetical protein [Agarivorans sp. TSD2052]UPW17017.1 hypothetical protein M0C34_12245 [Agarivorans sp. TSD2052]